MGNRENWAGNGDAGERVLPPTPAAKHTEHSIVSDLLDNSAKKWAGLASPLAVAVSFASQTSQLTGLLQSNISELCDLSIQFSFAVFFPGNRYRLRIVAIDFSRGGTAAGRSPQSGSLSRTRP